MKINGVNISPLDFERWAMDDLQKEINNWAVEALPAATTLAHYEKLQKEVLELGDALRNRHSAKHDAGQEIADCIMILLAIAQKNGYSAAEEIRKKFEINKKRKWGPPDANGVYQHLEGS